MYLCCICAMMTNRFTITGKGDKMKVHNISHLVKSEDLNHHGTLYAGRAAEWLVESGFVAAAAGHGQPQDIVCINVHGFVFKIPVQRGTILTMSSRIARVGRSSITVYVKAVNEITQTKYLDSFLTFVCLDPGTDKAMPHGIILDKIESPEEEEIRERANRLFE